MSQAVEPSPLCPAQQLTRSGLRKDDPLDQVLKPPLRKPVYILLQDTSVPSAWLNNWNFLVC